MLHTTGPHCPPCELGLGAVMPGGTSLAWREHTAHGAALSKLPSLNGMPLPARHCAEHGRDTLLQFSYDKEAIPEKSSFLFKKKKRFSI